MHPVAGFHSSRPLRGVTHSVNPVIKQRFVVTIHKLDKRVAIAGLGLSHQQRLFQSLQPALFRALRAMVHLSLAKYPGAARRFKEF